MKSLGDQQSLYPTAEQLKERLYHYLHGYQKKSALPDRTSGKKEALLQQYFYLTENPSSYCISLSNPLFLQSKGQLPVPWVVL
ncbi:hypothetical protein BH24BAC1_BH24BAC1_36990 [soil metagenome]|jgi:hypothetical protein